MKLSEWIVKKRKILFCATLACAALCLILLLNIHINNDMTEYLPDSSSMKQGIDIMKEEWTGMDMTLAASTMSELPAWIVAVAIVLVVLILVLASNSLVEPAFYLFTIGAAVLINMGTNYFMPGHRISDITFSIAALLQLVLSLDYAVILSNRFRQESIACGVETDSGASREQLTGAMTRAVKGSLKSVAGSGLTTIVGLLTLMFMSFSLGGELGIVLAKGAFCSMICTFTMLPFLLVHFHGLILKTRKKAVSLPTGGLAAFSVKFRYAILAFTVIFGVIVFAKHGGTDLAFILETEDMKNSGDVVMVLYENEDDEAVTAVAEKLNGMPQVNAALCWGNTFGAYETPGEMMLHFPELMDLFQNAKGLLSLLPEDVDPYSAEMIEQMGAMLKGKNYSLLMIDLGLRKGSDETYALLDELDTDLKSGLKGEYHMIGESVMAWEMTYTFGAEMNRITIFTAAAIFIVVLLSFRTLVIPAVLVAIIQTAVYLTMIIIHLQGSSIYYLAFLMVQSILMGATIDYAIVYSNYYREARAGLDIAGSVREAYRNSINTVLTSSLIIIIVTFLLGYAFPNPTVGEICHTISLGCTSALLMILFLLPGVLAALDRIEGKEKKCN